jgi:hypothetical protein
VVNAELQFFSKTRGRIDTCMIYTRPPLAIEIDTIKKAFVDGKRRSVRLRYLTEIKRQSFLLQRTDDDGRRAKTSRRNKRKFYAK